MLRMKTIFEKLNIKAVLIAAYILIVLMFSAISKAQVSLDPVLGDKPALALSVVSGQIAMTPDFDFYLVVSESEYYQLAANIDLSPYNGQFVAIDGVKVMSKTEPSSSFNTVDPLPRANEAEGVVKTLVVLGIRELVN